MNRFRRRTWAVTSGLAACGLTATVALTGCSSGQVSQMSTQEPAVNGTVAAVGPLDLRNIHLRGEQTGDAIQPGSDVELVFVVATDEPGVQDRLVSVTSDVGSVQLSGDTTVPTGGMLMVGEADGQLTDLPEVESVDTAEAQVSLTEPITNGLLYDFTFTFEEAGETTVAVPVSAGDSPRRGGIPGGGGGHGGGH